MKLISTVSLAFVVLVLATACMTGPAGSQGPAGSAYSPEAYDDCRDAFNSFSPAALRQMLAASGDEAELGELTEDDVRAMLELGCLAIAMGADTLWGDLSW